MTDAQFVKLFSYVDELRTQLHVGNNENARELADSLMLDFIWDLPFAPTCHQCGGECRAETMTVENGDAVCLNCQPIVASIRKREARDEHELELRRIA